MRFRCCSWGDGVSKSEGVEDEELVEEGNKRCFCVYDWGWSPVRRESNVVLPDPDRT